MPSNHLILCHPLLFLPSIFPSIRVFSSESVLCIRWPKHWGFSFNISSSNEHSGLISFRMDWLDLLAVQGTLKSLLQQHSWKAQFKRGRCYNSFPNLMSLSIIQGYIACKLWKVGSEPDPCKSQSNRETLCQKNKNKKARSG